MDSTLNAAALALATGDVLGALNRVALRDDAPALALRGTAMAQLGDLPRARDLLRQAERAFGREEVVARARCVLAQAEIALVSRDLAWPDGWLEQAGETLARRGDRLNAAHARIIEARRHLLLGHPETAESRLVGIEIDGLPPTLVAGFWLIRTGIDVRRLRINSAKAAFRLAEAAASRASTPGLIAEVAAMGQALTEPVAMLHRAGTDMPVDLGGVEVLYASPALIVDATRNAVRRRDVMIPLATRPVLFGLFRVMAEAFPAEASREALLRRVFRAREADESHRGRLRVEIARLRQVVADVAEIAATPAGFRLLTDAPEVAVIATPLEGQNAAVMALLSDGELWSSSALALVLDSSARTIQRALQELEQTGKVRAIGKGRAQRWSALTLPGFPTTLLLPGER